MVRALHILNSFNKTIHVWVEGLKYYSMEELQRRPAAGEWSLGQVYKHIIDDTNFFIKQAEASLSDVENSDEPMHEDAEHMFANNSFPAMKLANPYNDINMPQPKSIPALMQALESISLTVNHMAHYNNLEACIGKSQHPGLGYFNALQWLQFADMHMRHHLRQKERIDIAIRF